MNIPKKIIILSSETDILYPGSFLHLAICSKNLTRDCESPPVVSDFAFEIIMVRFGDWSLSRGFVLYERTFVNLTGHEFELAPAMADTIFHFTFVNIFARLRIRTATVGHIIVEFALNLSSTL